jgi:(p)ppGpp synthase/HD superfamily hydrolase
LHDVIEDCGLEHGDRLRAMFGARVANIVEGCTDGAPDEAGEKAPWRDRKEAYLAHLADAHPDTLLVSACDKLHNARAIVADVRALGPDVFSRFKAGREGTLWYYGRLAETFAERLGPQHPLVLELSATVGEMVA